MIKGIEAFIHYFKRQSPQKKNREIVVSKSLVFAHVGFGADVHFDYNNVTWIVVYKIKMITVLGCVDEMQIGHLFVAMSVVVVVVVI